MRPLSCGQNGFSLLEVLMAVAILAGLAMAFGPMLSAASHASARIHHEAAAAEDARVAKRVLHDILTQTIQVDLGDGRPSVFGDARRLTVTTLDAETMTPVSIELTISQGETRQLIARVSPLNAEGPGFEEKQSFVIMRDLAQARFQYLATENSPPRWRSRWRDEAPPALIRLSGANAVGAHEHAFLFEAAPKGVAPLVCAFDPVSRQCR